MRAEKIFSLTVKRNLRQRCHRPQLFVFRQLSASKSKASEDCSVALFDSLSDRIQPLPSVKGKGLAWYTCGPTTYAPAHLGHARTYVCLDVARRVLEAQLHMEQDAIPPLFVMNITDVDDKILVTASEQQVSPMDLARKFEAEFWKDLDALNCLRPHVVTRVTESIESHIVPYIERLVQNGMAYETEDGVYFDVRAYSERLGKITRYGKLAPAAAAQDMDITRRTDMEPIGSSTKKDPRDFVLWKRKKPDESVSWPSPWGDGRPGWHIECSAMIEAVQTQFQSTHQFLVHAGGVDLKFPHHTNEIAQSEAYQLTGNWIPHWVHTGHLHIDGLKMSKSLKNFISIQEFLVEYNKGSALDSPSDDFRLWCLGLSGSYRGPATFSKERLDEARTIRQRILRFLMDGQIWASDREDKTRVWEDVDHKFWLDCQDARQVGMKALSNDLDGSEFLRQCLRIVDLGNHHMSLKLKGPTEPMGTALSTLRGLLALVGFSDKTTKVGLSDGTVAAPDATNEVVGGERAVIDIMVKFRSAARHAALKNVKSGEATSGMRQILDLCDHLRDFDLPKIGIELIDDDATEDNMDAWRTCLPKSNPKKLGDGSKNSEVSEPIDLEKVPLEDLFRVGQYQGLFMHYSASGIPTHNADGSEVSKRALKKLLKKREAHKVRLEK